MDFRLAHMKLDCVTVHQSDSPDLANNNIMRKFYIISPLVGRSSVGAAPDDEGAVDVVSSPCCGNWSCGGACCCCCRFGIRPPRFIAEPSTCGGGTRFNGPGPPSIDMLNGGSMGNGIGTGMDNAACSDFRSVPGRNRPGSTTPLDNTSD